MIVKIAGQALRQFAVMMVVNVDKSGDALLVSPLAINQAASAPMPQDIVYTYRPKHGFQRCYHRNRFGTRSWWSIFRRIPDC
jgi:hypothetical protein